MSLAAAASVAVWLGGGVGGMPAGASRLAASVGIAQRGHPPARSGREVVVHVVQTTASLSERMKRMADISMKPGVARAAHVVRVEDTVRYQAIMGFGAALTDSSAWLMHHVLPRRVRDQLIRELFSPEGVDLNFIRLPMGGSEFTVKGRFYSYDDVPPGESDFTLAHFSVAHDLRDIVPILRDALANGTGLFLIANPWSAPAWMKTNQRSDNFSNAGRLMPSAYAPYAAYFVKFVEAYRRLGVRIQALTPQNEPGVAADPGMEWPEPDEATFITRYLAPALTAARLRTEIFGLDLSWDLSSYADAMAAGPARPYLSGMSWHCYFGSPIAMTQFHTFAPGLTQLLTECSPELRPFSTAQLLIGSLRNWASAVAFYNLALDPAGGPVEQPNHRCRGCRGIVSIDPRTHRIRRGLRYYQLGQLSKFVHRGAVRIGSNTFVSDATNPFNHFYDTTPGLNDVAFMNPDGGKVLTTYNNSRRTIQFAVSWHGLFWLYRQPPHAMTTFSWK